MATKLDPRAKKPAPKKKAAKKKTAATKRRNATARNATHPDGGPLVNITPAEAIYSFMGFLTTRDKELILSAHNDASPVAELAGKFIEANGIGSTTDGWPNWVVPPNTEHITNVPPVGYAEKSIGAPALDPEKARLTMLDALLGMDANQQDAAIAGLLTTIQKQRLRRVDNMQQTINDIQRDMEGAMTSLTNFNSVLRGDFAVVKIPSHD